MTMCMASAILAIYVYVESYEAWARSWDARWGFLLQDWLGPVELPDVAPVFLGEFGTGDNTNHWRYLLQYVKDKPVAGWAYWPLNGEKRTNKSEHYGLLMEDMQMPRHPWLLTDLQGLAKSRGLNR
mmetsp:Transcript_37754/g.68267  ORF Transcript_37754/g.68267 Transcript_37754/m.68267 type:complete len:126 (-) Transcript_37754:7-384(-)